MTLRVENDGDCFETVLGLYTSESAVLGAVDGHHVDGQEEMQHETVRGLQSGRSMVGWR